MREVCENKDDLKFFMCELINTHIEDDPLIKGDRKKFSKSTSGNVSEPLLSRIKNYDIDAVKIDAIMVVLFYLKIELALDFDLKQIIKEDNESRITNKNSFSNDPSF